MKKVAVIGAGPSGITAIKNLKEKGFDVIGFERCSGVGGNWRYDEHILKVSSFGVVKQLRVFEVLGGTSGGGSWEGHLGEVSGRDIQERHLGWTSWR